MDYDVDGSGNINILGNNIHKDEVERQRMMSTI